MQSGHLGGNAPESSYLVEGAAAACIVPASWDLLLGRRSVIPPLLQCRRVSAAAGHLISFGVKSLLRALCVLCQERIFFGSVCRALPGRGRLARRRPSFVLAFCCSYRRSAPAPRLLPPGGKIPGPRDGRGLLTERFLKIEHSHSSGSPEPEWQDRLTEVNLRALPPLKRRHINRTGYSLRTCKSVCRLSRWRISLALLCRKTHRMPLAGFNQFWLSSSEPEPRFQVSEAGSWHPAGGRCLVSNDALDSCLTCGADRVVRIGSRGAFRLLRNL